MTARLDPRYFDSDNVCKEHGNYKCDECMDTSHSGASQALTVVSSSSTEVKERQRDVARQNFSDQVKFIQVALDMDEEHLDKIKIKEMGSYIEKSKDSITVGKMKKLLKTGGNGGVILGFIRWIKIRFNW